MEPAVKPAAEQTRTGKVGVLATPATFQGDLYASVVERFAAGVELLQSTCPGLVEVIEQGDLDSDAARSILERALLPMLEKKIDTVVLGCTHYPFVIPLIREIAGENVRVIDPAPAVARQACRLLEGGGLRNQAGERGVLQFFTTGATGALTALLPKLLGENGSVEPAYWDEGIQLSAG
jgi:glutamate racemase